MKRASINPVLVSIPGAAVYLGVSERTVKRYIESGQLKTRRLPDPELRAGTFLDKTLIHVTELDRLINSGVEV